MLPDSGSVWPPKPYKSAFDLMAVHDAWYCGDADELAALYQNRTLVTRPAQHSGGIVGLAARFWWGRPQQGTETRTKAHLPIAASLSAASADVLFSEPPTIRLIRDRNETSESPEEQRLDLVVNTPLLHTRLLEAAELASAHGGVYLRLVWSPTLDHVEPDVVHADMAIPEFRYGRLAAVTFWTEVRRDSQGEDAGAVYRWVERHEPGRIEHGLYQGTDDSLGDAISLAGDPTTRWLYDAIDDIENPTTIGDNGYSAIIATGISRLTATYVPNILPNRFFRKDPIVREFGRSDYQGIEDAFDRIDEAWSSWARDLRLAKARIIVPNAFLDSGGPGHGARFDTDREVFEGLEFLDLNGQQMITPQQFQIRVAEHERTISEWTRYALRTAGYTPGSLGDAPGGLRTATEVNSDDRLTERTRDKKSNYWRAALLDFVRAWIELENQVVAPTGIDVDRLEVRFPAESQQDPEEIARIASMLSAARAVSIRTSVQMVHPEWGETAIAEEVDRIYREHGIMAGPDAALVPGFEIPTPPMTEAPA